MRPETPGQQQPSPLGPDEERAWLRRVVDADSARLSVLRAENGRLRAALKDILDAAERAHTGFLIESEEWYARRDFARNVLRTVDE